MRARFVGQLAGVHVEAGTEVRIVEQGLTVAFVGQGQGERQGGVVQSQSRRAGAAAVELGFFREEGSIWSSSIIFPSTNAAS